MGDFAAGLSAAFTQREDIAEGDGAFQAVYELSFQLDNLRSDCKLQLCTWHAAEAIKRRFTAEGYPFDMRKELHSLV